MARAWSWFAVSLLVAATAAATVVEKRVRHTIRPDGSVLEVTALEVRLDSEGDLDEWSPYYLYLDDNRTLERITAAATRPDGSRVVVKSRLQDRLEIARPGVLHDSMAFQEIPFPSLPVGSVLSIEHTVRVEPYFPSGRVELAESDSVERLSVEVTGMADGWRWQLEGAVPDSRTVEADGSFRLEIADLPDAETLQDEAGDGGKMPVLRYAWGPEDTWPEVAGWYEELLRDVPRRPAAVASLARELAAGVAEPRQRLEALLDFMRRDVRYVAVQVGVGGYRPSPPEAVLERRWGDCKDKALLFIDLLGEAGIPGYPVLIRSSSGDDVDPDFPVPNLFNHLIVAVPSDAVAVQDGDPIAGGLLFIDPTQERGSAGYLHPWVQGKNALVVRGDRSQLILTPDRFLEESEALTVELTITPAGDAVGRAEVLLRGSAAAVVTAELRSPRAEEVFLRFLGRRLPGFDVREPSWQSEPGDAPVLRMTAAVQISGFAAAGGAGPSLRLPAVAATPSSRELAGETVATLRPGSWQTRWRLDLPPGWCPPETADVAVANDTGSFRQTIAPTQHGVEIERRVDLRSQRVEGESLAALTELSGAEHRTLKRRLRFGCGS